MIRVAVGLVALALLLGDPDLGRVSAADLPQTLKPLPVASVHARSHLQQGPRLDAAADFLHESSFLGSTTAAELQVTGQATTADGIQFAGMVNAQQRFTQAPGHAPTNERAVSLIVVALRGPTQAIASGALVSGPHGTTSWLGMNGESTTSRSTFGVRADLQASSGESPAYSVRGYLGIRY
ncbi:MAG: hypothetical protein K1X57_16865 [Gemmataceae bacterium]|nr:hypothetical protein [Gemmataceae bacterium]